MLLQQPCHGRRYSGILPSGSSLLKSRIMAIQIILLLLL